MGVVDMFRRQILICQRSYLHSYFDIVVLLSIMKDLRSYRQAIISSTLEAGCKGESLNLKY